jgi:hypothetical protein
MERKNVSLIGVLAFIVLLYVTFRLLQFPAGLFTTTFVGGLIVWLFTTYRVPVDPQKLIVPHLLAVMLFIVHVYEEFATHIEVVMTRLTGVQVSQDVFLTIAAFIAPVIWIVGLVMVLKRWAFGYFLVSVFYFGMMFGELTHFIFPLILDGRFHYMSGMYTALLPSAAGWYAFLVAWRDGHATKQSRPAG